MMLRDACPGTVARHVPGLSATAAMESTVRVSLVALMSSRKYSSWS
jgi:hypothetical protein